VIAIKVALAYLATGGSPMKIFVAGGTGAIGRALLEKLLANGHVLVALTRSPEKAQALVEQGIGPARERWSGSLTALSFQSDLNERNLCVVRQMVESCCFIRDCV